jgi:hypothetical protein
MKWRSGGCQSGQGCKLASDCIANGFTYVAFYCNPDHQCDLAMCESLPGQCQNGCVRKCPAGEPCKYDSDCQTNLYCGPASLCAALLGPGATCNADKHCQSGLCNLTCVALDATCGDGLLDGTETDVDCGGPACVRCAAKGACLHASDCKSMNCINNVCS